MSQKCAPRSPQLGQERHEVALQYSFYDMRKVLFRVLLSIFFPTLFQIKLVRSGLETNQSEHNN